MIVVFICIVFIIYVLLKTNNILRPQLMAVAKKKTNDAISLLVQRVLSEIEYNVYDLIDYEYSEYGDIISIQYDTKKINDLLEESLQVVDASLEAASKGEEDPILKEVVYEDGIIYSVPIGYLTRISFLQNYGYEFDIGMRIFHYINGDIDVITKPYGVNNTLIQVNLCLSIEGEAITAIYREKIHFKEEIPLIIQVVQGDVPDYANIKKE